MLSSGRAALAVAGGLIALACKYEPTEDPSASEPRLNPGARIVSIEPAPEQLRGRVALPAGARLYARPNYASPSWELRLPEPPLHAGADQGPPRTRAFRVVGVVRVTDPVLGDTQGTRNEFLAVTNDLDGEDTETTAGCGPRFRELDHLRVLLYVPSVHLAEVTTRSLSLEPFSPSGDREQLELGAGVRIGPVSPTRGLPSAPTGTQWRWIDADGLRALAPIPDDAIGLAWDPGDTPTLGDAGEALLRDAEGSTLWLRDDGGDTVELSTRNECGEHRRRVTDSAQVENLRSLALDVFYDQSPPPDPTPTVPPDADFLVVGGTALKWTDDELAGEILDDWPVSVGIGQTWGGKRCFPLILGGELVPLDEPAMACVAPSALEPLAGNVGFAVSDELELGGSIELGPVEVVVGDWDPTSLRPTLNAHHGSVAECVRPLLTETEDEVLATRWVVAMIVGETGSVDEVEVTALAATHPAVEDCLRAEAFTWLLPEGGAHLRVPVTLGDWDEAAVDVSMPEPTDEPEPADEERGKVIIIRDDDSPE